MDTDRLSPHAARSTLSTLSASLRYLLPCPPGRRGRQQPEAPDVPAAVPSEEDRLQAQALCDLLTDPESGVTRVRLVGAPAGLRGAVERAAAARGVPAAGDLLGLPGLPGLPGQSARKR
jgi:hypothetical protein